MVLSLLVHDGFANNCQTDVFYGDIRKAFDVINNIALIFKLSDAKYRFSNSLLLWFRSFFHGRRQFVKINSILSIVIEVLSGIGQGSILAALIFLVFFNDSDCNSSITTDLNFADDKKIVHNRISSIDDTKLLQSSIDKFVKWCSDNGFELNTDKCKIMSISKKRSPILADYYIDGKLIKRVHSYKDLGVTYNDEFSFNDHFELSTKKGMSMLSFVKRQCYGRFNLDTARMLYSAIVRSHLEFASPVWAPHHAVHIKSFESVQRQFVLYANRDRYVNENQDSYQLRPYLDRCNEIRLTSLLRRRTDAAVFFIHDILTGKINVQFLRDRIHLYDGSRCLRYPSFIRINRSNNVYSRFSPFNFACQLFNMAAAHVDPSLPSLLFRQSVLKLDDSIFEKFGNPDA